MELASRITSSAGLSNTWDKNNASMQAAQDKGRVQSAIFEAASSDQRIKTGSAYVQASSRSSAVERNTYLANVEETKRATRQVVQRVAHQTSNTNAAIAQILAQPAPASFSRNLGNFVDRYA